MIVSHQLGRPAPQAASPRNLCVRRLSRSGRGVGARPDFVGEFLGALDSSSLGLTFNLQSEVRRLSRPEIPTRPGLSTFNRVSFPSPSSPHLCALCVLCGENSSSFRSSLIPRHSPLATKSFTIRTSKTPLPQLLYNPHLRAPLGSAGNKGLITPLESALTKNSPVTSLESALTKTGGWGYGVSRSAKKAKFSATRKERNQDLIWPEAASQVTAARRKYDSLAMWHASAALWPKTASSVTGRRFFTPWKNFQRCGFSSSQETPR